VQDPPSGCACPALAVLARGAAAAVDDALQEASGEAVADAGRTLAAGLRPHSLSFGLVEHRLPHAMAAQRLQRAGPFVVRKWCFIGQ